MQNRSGALTALQRNGELLPCNLIIGVKPLSASQREDVKRSKEAKQSEATRNGPALTRPDQYVNHIPTALPQPSKTLAQLVKEFVIGV